MTMVGAVWSHSASALQGLGALCKTGREDVVDEGDVPITITRVD